MVKQLNIFLEPMPGVANDDAKSIRALADAPMAELGAEFANYASFDALSSRFGRLEPMWRYIVASPVDGLAERIAADPVGIVPGYVAHAA